MKTLRPSDVAVSVDRVEAAEVDEMWSFVGKKQEPRWLWHAIDHWTGKVLAYVFGRRRDEVFLQLKAVLEPFGIARFFTDQWGYTPGTWLPKLMFLANVIRSRLNESISPSAPVSSGLHAKRSVFPNPLSSTTSS